MAARRESITRNVPLHQHEGVEQIFIISGQGSITVNGLTYGIEGGSFINLNPYHFYSIKVEEEMRLYSLSGSLALPVTSTLHGFVNENI